MAAVVSPCALVVKPWLVTTLEVMALEVTAAVERGAEVIAALVTGLVVKAEEVTS